MDPILFSPLEIKNITLKNRMMVSPMCMYSCVDGFATDFHLAHLGAAAIGGFGLIMEEATAISPEGRITYRDLGIWSDEHISKLKQIVDFVHSQNTHIGIQLAHAGRKASHQPPFEGRAEIAPDHPDGWQTFGPSAIPVRDGDVGPIALDKKGIQKVKDDFLAATKRVKAVGYDIIEIHAAHGYLLHQFYSPLTNHRTDEYGGSFENRIRLTLEVVELIRDEWGKDKPLFLRLSATDWVDDGWTIEDSVKLAKILKERGVDLIDTSTGGNWRAKIPVGPGYQTEFSDRIRKESGILTGTVGRITSAQQAETILRLDNADLVVFGHQMLLDPHFPIAAARTLGVQPDWPIQYGWAFQ